MNRVKYHLEKWCRWTAKCKKRKENNMCVNTVCLRFSHECSQFSQSSYFLEFRVKNVFRIKYLESFMY